MAIKMVDMVKTPEEMKEGMPMALSDSAMPVYPYGLSISLTQDELEKLDLESDCEVGEVIHLVAMAKVTSKSESETTDEKKCRIELQIVMLGLEDEDEESEEDERPAIRATKLMAKMYGK